MEELQSDRRWRQGFARSREHLHHHRVHLVRSLTLFLLSEGLLPVGLPWAGNEGSVHTVPCSPYVPLNVPMYVPVLLAGSHVPYTFPFLLFSFFVFVFVQFV